MTNTQLRAFNPDCFPFYNGSTVCDRCAASRRCKALLASDGFDIVAGLIEQLVATMNPASLFRDTDVLEERVDQLISPPAELTKEEMELLNLVNGPQAVADLKLASI